MHPVVEALLARDLSTIIAELAPLVAFLLQWLSAAVLAVILFSAAVAVANVARRSRDMAAHHAPGMVPLSRPSRRSAGSVHIVVGRVRLDSGGRRAGAVNRIWPN